MGVCCMWTLVNLLMNKNVTQLDHNRCLRTVSESTNCSNCIDVCPQPALNIQERKLKFTSSNCSNCKLCIHSCPTEAINNQTEKLVFYEQKIRQRNEVIFACNEHGLTDKHLIVPCIFLLTPELLMMTTFYNKDVKILWNNKICLSCHSNWTDEKCLKWLEDWQNALCDGKEIELIGSSKKIGGISSITSQIKQKMKRERNNSEESILDDFHMKFNLSEKIFITERRQLALAFFDKLKKEGKIPRGLSQKLNLVHVKTKKSCNICKKCTNACPTGALSVETTTTERSLIFKPRYCINCDICENICLEIKKDGLKFEDINKDLKIRTLVTTTEPTAFQNNPTRF